VIVYKWFFTFYQLEISILRKIKAILVNKDKTLEIRKVWVEENKAILGRGRKQMEFLFEPQDVFFRKRRFLPPEPCLILEEGSLKAVKYQSKLEFPLTTFEIKDLIKREIAKARMKFKPISLGMFIVLALLIAFNIILTLLILSGGRVVLR